MENCRKSGIFYPIWANFVALTWEISSKCDAPIGKNKIVFKPLILKKNALNFFFDENLNF